MSDTSTPPCFEPFEFEEWLRFARLSNFRNRTERFCQDCTPAYKASQLAQGKCSRPDTQFVRLLPTEDDPDDEPSLVGVSPATLEIMTKMKRVAE